MCSYKYEIFFLDDYDDENYTAEGIVFAEEFEDAIESLSRYYGGRIHSVTLSFFNDSEVVERVCKLEGDTE